MEVTKSAGAVSRLLDRLMNSLTDLAQRDRSVLTVLGGYLLVWTLYGVISKNSQDLHPDMTELIAWSRDLALGFPKHPPFAAVVVRGWFALFPIADWAFYLLAILTATSALWIAWQQFAEYLDPRKCLVALCLLTFVPFFNFHALKFNVNTILMPLWAVTTFWFLRSYRTRDATYAALAGVAAAVCMMSKYWSVFLLAGLAIAALSDPRRGAYFRSAAPWITIVTGIAILSPHIGWLQKHDFSPVDYAMAVHGGHSVSQALWADLRYSLDSIAYVLLPVAVVVLLARPGLKTVADMAWPAEIDRRLVAVAFWTTLLLPTLPALLWGVEIHGIWSMSSWTLLPIMLLSPPAIELAASSVRRIVGFAIILPLTMLIAAPGVALVRHWLGVPPELAHSRMLAERVETGWHDATTSPLRYVGGDMADGVLTYARSRPELMLDFPPGNKKRIVESGIALVCTADDAYCAIASANVANANPQSRKIETQLVRSFLGIRGEPQGYLIFIVPPI